MHTTMNEVRAVECRAWPSDVAAQQGSVLIQRDAIARPPWSVRIDHHETIPNRPGGSSLA